MRFICCLFASLLVSLLSFAETACKAEEADSLTNILSHNRAVLVGDLHGNAQMPAEFLRIVQESANLRSRIVVALEYKAVWQDQLDHIFASESEDEAGRRFEVLSTGDGRTSEAMKDMLKGLWTLKQTHHGLVVVGVDYWASDYPDAERSMPEWVPNTIDPEKSLRDVRMGENAIGACRQAECDALLFFAGNFHTKKTISIGGAWDIDTNALVKFPVVPSGAVISAAMPTASIYLSHRGGSISANVDGQYGEREFRSNSPNYVRADHVPYCAYKTDLAYDYIMSVGEISSSIDQSVQSGEPK